MRRVVEKGEKFQMAKFVFLKYTFMDPVNTVVSTQGQAVMKSKVLPDMLAAFGMPRDYPGEQWWKEEQLAEWDREEEEAAAAAAKDKSSLAATAGEGAAELRAASADVVEQEAAATTSKRDHASSVHGGTGEEAAEGGKLDEGFVGKKAKAASD